MPTDIEYAYAGLQGKQERYEALWDWYQGNHPLVYNASKLREIFKNLDANFSENWCGVVVNTILDRVAIERFQIGDGKNEAAQDALAQLWRSTELELDAYDAHLCALVTGESFIVCGVDDAGDIEAYFNDSRLCHMIYEEAKPHTPRFAAKWYELTDAETGSVSTHMTLYYPDRFEYWLANQPRDRLSSSKAFTLQSTAANPYGEIPVYHLRRERRELSSELADIIPLQAQLNKMLADMMIAAEFGAFKQRYVIASFVGDGTALRLKNSPNEIWTLPGGAEGDQPTSVGEFAATELANYLSAIERSANVIATVAGIPKTLLVATGDVPSGASLRALEAPLIKKAERYANRFEPVWRRVLQWLMMVSGEGAINPDDIDIIWAETGTTQPEEDATTAKLWVEAGMPLRTALRRQGWGETEMEQLEQDESDEQAKAATLAQAYMQQAETNASRQAGETASNGAAPRRSPFLGQ